MNSEEKISVLNNFIKTLDQEKSISRLNSQSNINNLRVQDFNQNNLPQLDIVGTLIKHHKKINSVVKGTHEGVQDVVKELGQLQNRKHNVNKLLDSMTAIKEAKRLSYGLGQNPSQVYKNLQVYEMIRQKIFYCDKYVQKIQKQIQQLEQKYRQHLQQQLSKPNSQSVTLIAKILGLISQLNKTQNTDNNQNLKKKLCNFYRYTLSQQLKKYQNDLFNIPISGNSTNSVYIFFDIAKDVMKSAVSLISTYRDNIVKIGGQQYLQAVILSIFSCLTEGIILQILMRQKKYFGIDSIQNTKMGKEGATKFKDYFNQFSAIQNQIQRLRIHFSLQISQNYVNLVGYNRELTNCTNTASMIQISTTALSLLKNYTRSQFDKLLKKSPFVIPLWQYDNQFLQKTYDNWKNSDKQWLQSIQGHEYLTSSFAVFTKSLQKSFETLNILIISQMISFLNNNLVQEDSFHAFNQIFDKTISKFPSNQQKYSTVIILIVNYLFLMPNALQVEIDSLIIPQELQNYNKRLTSQLKQLVVACEHKCKQVIDSFLNAIVKADFTKNELIQNYKKVLEKWKGFIQEPNSQFLKKLGQNHSKIIFQQQFLIPLKAKKPIFKDHFLINLEKQVRNIISFYEISGHSVVKKFDKILQFIQILLADNQESFTKLIKSFKIQSHEQKQQLIQLRNLKS